MIRVVVADDQPLVRVGFVTFLGAQPGIEIVGEAGDGAESVRVVSETVPDVVLMDVRMPAFDGIEATRRIATAFGSRIAVIILTTFDFDEYVFSALRAGASGFLLKDTRPEDLVQAVRAVASGDALLAPAVTKRLIKEFVRGPVVGLGELDALTKRENEIMVLVARGLSNSEIAERYHLSEATVKTHVNRLMNKLELSSRAQVVVAAYEAGLVVPSRFSG
ncbi:response regulator transcription factor [Lentzea sp. BCCO 10_0798]|uniref:Response regulator transcription factor n=1 Tax=Lentzea kristufekii TaxID=3095430 RepID=A0ABU4TNP7_9PSEU|nr:response regulator transcription factor [Lentzea sp. BCCO 10_0798]MDX8049915.1 response regulator transcription factor [Lentzea sp. BCCO 10_0798]